MDNIDWNDLRYLLAIARSGSAAGAARALGVSHATALRRIQLLEKQVGTALFDRLQTGYVPTGPGRRFVEVGEAFETALTGTHREVEGQGTELAGQVSFTTTDSLAYMFMPDILRSFRVRYPNIRVDMRVSNGELDLERREADVALRPTGAPPAGCVGKCLRQGAWGLYASAAYLAQRPGDAGAVHAWLVPELALAQGPIRQWLELRMGAGAVAATADSFLMLRQLADRGMGIALLPKIITQGSKLVLLEDPPVPVNGGLWLLTHPHLRQLGRIRAFMEHVTDAMRELAA